MLANADLARLVMPLAIGLLIGLERGWHQRAARPGSRVAGLRTFGLFGLIGGLAGFAAGMAQGWAVSAAFLLSQRARLHGWIAGLSEADFHAVVLFAVLAGALWPVLPDRAMGPMNAWNPRELWLVVVIVCAISFAGYALGRRMGPKRGLLVTAAVGAIYSSTAVTAALAQRLKAEPEARALLAAGIAIASLVMIARVAVLVGLLAPFALIGFARVVAPAVLVALAAALVLARRAATAPAGPAPTGNPFALLPALGFAVLVALVQLVVHWMQARYGDRGVAVTLALAGAMDVDAAIVGLRTLPPGSIAPGLAGTLLALPVLLNTLLKLGVVWITGGRAGAWAGLSLALAALAMLAGFAVVAPGLADTLSLPLPLAP